MLRKIIRIFFTIIPVVSLAQKHSLTTKQMFLSNFSLKTTPSEYDIANLVEHWGNDTAIVCGYISDPEKHSTHNTIYQTFDGGKSWKPKNFEGNAWIYNVFHLNHGLVWMGGSDEKIYFSRDYGSIWQTKTPIFEPTDRIYAIYMVDSAHGIAGGLHNGLALTNDNWKTTQNLPSPLDQGNYQILKNSSRDRISKVQLLDSIVLINQNDHIYCMHLRDKIWRKFYIPVLDFDANKKNKRWKLFSLNGRVYTLDNQLNQIYTSIEPDFYKELYRSDTSNIHPINFESFFAPGITKVSITSIIYDQTEEIKGCLMIPVYNKIKQRIDFSCVKGACYPQTATIPQTEKNTTRFRIEEIQHVLNAENPTIYSIPENLKFTTSDYKDYDSLLKATRLQRVEDKKWGGDFSYLIDLNHSYFDHYESLLDTPKVEVFENIFIQNHFEPNDTLHQPRIEVQIINSMNDTMQITSSANKNMNLPWHIKTKDQEIRSYNPAITKILNYITYFKFNEQLTSSHMILKIIENTIVEEEVYANPINNSKINE